MHKIITRDISFIIFILFLVSMNHWIGWYYKNYFSIFGGILLIAIVLRNNYLLDLSHRNILSSVLLYIGYLIGAIGWRGNLLDRALYTQIFSFAIPIFIMLCLRVSGKLLLLEQITKWFAWLMIPAILLYFITMFVDLPSLGIVKWRNEELQEKGYGVCYNYFFFLKPIYLDAGATIARFRGPFLEPGHLGTVCAFLLFANHHDYSKRDNKVIMFTLFLTLSLAGWLLWVIGFILCRYNQGRMKLKNIIVYIIILISFIVLVNLNSSGDNLVNNAIFSRLEYDSSKGISGNNRNNEYTDYLFSAMWTDSNLILNGYKDSYIEVLNTDFRTRVTGSGVVHFIVLRGLIGLFGALVFYIFYAFSALNKRFAKFALLFFICCFIQRCYFSWYAWILCYTWAICKADMEINNNKS